MLAKIYINNEDMILEEVVKVDTTIKDSELEMLDNAILAFCKDKFGPCSLENRSNIAYIGDNAISNFKEYKGSAQNKISRSSSLIGVSKLKDNIVHDYPEFTIVKKSSGEEFTLAIGVELFCEGFVLNLGKQMSNFMGSTYDAYLNKMTSRSGGVRIYSSKKIYAKQFKTLASIIKYLRKYESSLKYFNTNNGYVYNLEYASPLSKEIFEEKLGIKNKTALKYKEQIKEVQNILSDFNETTGKEPIFGKDQKEEAILRMLDLNIMKDVIKEFKDNDKIMMSDIGGIIYDLDENAKALVEAVRKPGNLPYHVVKTADIYCVLSVDKDRNLWESERYSKSTNLIECRASNGQGGYSSYEFGPIKILPASGGVNRVPIEPNFAENELTVTII